jgi:hypothetical protein
MTDAMRRKLKKRFCLRNRQIHRSPSDFHVAGRNSLQEW